MPFPDPTKAGSMKSFVGMAEEVYFKKQCCDFPDKKNSEFLKKVSQKLKGA